MTYTLTLRDTQLRDLRNAVFSIPGVEGAAFLLCGESRTSNEVRLLCRDIVPVATEHYALRRANLLSLDSAAFTPVAKRARREGLSVVFVHSHLRSFLTFSKQDDREEPKLQEFLASRAPQNLHGSLVLTETGVIGRVWIGSFEGMSRVRVIGRRFEFHDIASDASTVPPFFDRQVRAFGPDIQAVLGRLHIGVVGAGGTGSAVVEELTRLGVGTISVFDRDIFDDSNVNRVFGSSVHDATVEKVQIAAKNVRRIGLSTVIHPIPKHITQESIAKELRDCDIVFGCTDKQAPRAILVQLALRYLIPVFDMGVLIDSSEGTILDVIGRVTTLIPGEACLFCRGDITPEAIRLESLTDEERASLAAEGYAPELSTPAPAVVPFTAAVASLAIVELLHRLTGFMGEDRVSSESLVFFDKSRIRTNRVPPSEECLCFMHQLWGRGDTPRFLGMSWAA